MVTLAIAIFLLCLLVVLVTVAMVRLWTSECPKCPDTGNLPTFECSNCTIPEPECNTCPADLSKCRATFPPDCTRCPTDCIKANLDPACTPNCSKCSTGCPVDLARCRDVLDNLSYGDAPNPFSRLPVLVNNLVEGRFGFSIRFKPAETQRGILCAFIEPTMVVLYLVDGKVRLYVKGSTSDQPYDDFPVSALVPEDEISTVALTTSAGSTDVLVTVNTAQQTVQVPVHLNLSSKMYLGGVPENNLSDLPSLAKVSFKGCIFEVRSAADSPLDLIKVTRSNVDLGCQ